MRQVGGFTLLLVLLFSQSAWGQANQEEGEEPLCITARGSVVAAGEGAFIAVYCEPRSSDYRDDYRSLVEDRHIEYLVDDMNQYVAIPANVYVTYQECGQPNAFYNPANQAITICYELYEEFERMFAAGGYEGEELDVAVSNAEQFIFFHEVGHALIDVLQLPVTGREEDAVDQLATYVATDGYEPGETAALDAAMGFYLMAQQAEQSGAPPAVWDEHGLEAQRFFNILCWLYGERPEDYSGLVSEGILPESRAVRCGNEWQRLDVGWTTLLGDNLIYDPTEDAGDVATTDDESEVGEYLAMTNPETYVEVYTHEDESYYTDQLVPEGQTAERWSDMLTTHIFANFEGSVADLRAGIVDGWRQACPGGGDFAQYDQDMLNGYPMEVWGLMCEQSPATGGLEYTIFKAIRGNESSYLVQKAYRYEPTEEQLDWWMRYLIELQVCDSRYPEHDCGD